MAAAAVSSSTFLNISAFLFFLLPSLVCSLSFDLSHIDQKDANEQRIKTGGDAYISGQGIQVTPYERNRALNGTAGRAMYAHPLHLWDKVTGELADFTTHFTFNIDSDGGTEFGDGLAFFLANFSDPFSKSLPGGGGLGLIDPNLITSPEPIVAVVFDTFSNDKSTPMTNVSINIKSMEASVNSTPWLNSIINGKDNNASITYSASSKILRVDFTGFWADYLWTGSLSYEVDLREYLPEFVHIGFSAATGSNFEKHTVSSWQFDSTPLRSDNASVSPAPSPSKPAASTTQNQLGGKKHKKGVVIAGLICIVLISLALMALAIYICFKKKRAAKRKNDNQIMVGEFEMAGCTPQNFSYRELASATNNFSEKRKLGEGGFGERVEKDDTQVTRGKAMDCEFENAGPKKFSYSELATATNNFSEEQKLGEGGFGGVYRGFLRDLKLDVAVKRVSSGSKQGIKEYAAEVKIISRLRQRNLVPLHGWCHEKGELLLVYEFMPEGSLDSHLFKTKSPLNWELRYRIAQGLASALFYLHEECEKCVLHRDIKSSNVLLDSSFNARLGDFGLASFVDHENSPEKTYLGGTPGYIAPECLYTGKTTKESDVYSFGIVALEIACGRSAAPWNESEGGKSLVGWVWNLYGMRKVLEAADPKLRRKFVKQEMERLMIIGMWCAHPDSKLRPEISQVVNCLKFQLQLPNLPTRMPKSPYSIPLVPLEYRFSSSSSSHPHTH